MEDQKAAFDLAFDKNDDLPESSEPEPTKKIEDDVDSIVSLEEIDSVSYITDATKVILTP